MLKHFTALCNFVYWCIASPSFQLFSQYSDFIGALEFKCSFGTFLSKGSKFLSGNERQVFCFLSPAGHVNAGREMTVASPIWILGEVTAPEGHTGTPEEEESGLFVCFSWKPWCTINSAKPTVSVQHLPVIFWIGALQISPFSRDADPGLPQVPSSTKPGADLGEQQHPR